VSFAEAERFCAQLTELAWRAGQLPSDWEFRLPTEAQWEYACRAGTTTATAFGDAIGTAQANFEDRPYGGAPAGPSLQRAAPVGGYPPSGYSLRSTTPYGLWLPRDRDNRPRVPELRSSSVRTGGVRTAWVISR
jgi:formylglycine-generating enzyme required for sulfatase activity